MIEMLKASPDDDDINLHFKRVYSVNICLDLDEVERRPIYYVPIYSTITVTLFKLPYNNKKCVR